jgi:hypothetical protein
MDLLTDVRRNADSSCSTTVRRRIGDSRTRTSSVTARIFGGLGPAGVDEDVERIPTSIGGRLIAGVGGNANRGGGSAGGRGKGRVGDVGVLDPWSARDPVPPFMLSLTSRSLGDGGDGNASGEMLRNDPSLRDG